MAQIHDLFPDAPRHKPNAAGIRNLKNDIDSMLADVQPVIERSERTLFRLTGRRTPKPRKVESEKPARKKLGRH